MTDLKRLTALAGQVRQRTERAQRPAPGHWYRIENATADSASVYLYGDIGADMWGDGTSAARFVTELNAVTARSIDLHVNSGGGQVFEGIAMHTAIAEHPARVTGYVDSIAASAASFILMACDEVKIARAGKMMIHDAATGFAVAEGNAATLRTFAQQVLDTADLLDEMSNTIADLYAERAGGTREMWRGAMEAETWYSAAQAVDAGLADAIIGAPPGSPAPAESNPAEAELDTSAFLAALKEAWDA